MSTRSFRQTIDADGLRPRFVSDGTDLFVEGQAGDGMYLVHSGTNALWREREGERVVLAEVGEGNIFGEMSLIDGSARTATATAIGDAVVVFVPLETFQLKLALSDPFIKDVMELLVRNVRNVNAMAEAARATARDQNPLTRLPGNRAIEGEINRALRDRVRAYSLFYFDFDNFKPFNDGFGFAVGDDAIALFADQLRAVSRSHTCFVGHVGGDDFFACMPGPSEVSGAAVANVLAQFRQAIRRFYDDQTWQRGTYLSKDRDGNLKTFPLLRTSAVQVDLPAGRGVVDADQIGVAIAAGKKQSKASATGLFRVALR